MDYVELNICVSDQDMSEILMAELGVYPFDSFDVEGSGPVTLKCYIPQAALADCKGSVDDVLAAYDVVTSSRYIAIESQNWNAVWESTFECVEVDRRLLIRAPFHASDSRFSRDVVIMPKMSFGTGHHATTHLMAAWCLDLGAELLLHGASVLDMGSGTGVLAIVAAMEGASCVDAVDIDSWAFENCTENIAANGVADIVRPILGDVGAASGHYDVILANINRNILLRDMERYVSMMNEGGVLIVSGFLEQDIDSLRDCGTKLGLTFIDSRLRDGWVALRFSL